MGVPSHVAHESVRGHAGDAVIQLGTMGRIYLMYLVVVMIAVLMNLERMLRMAQVTPNDYVVDLGSGDGRNVIAAAKRGARVLPIATATLRRKVRMKS